MLVRLRAYILLFRASLMYSSKAWVYLHYVDYVGQGTRHELNAIVICAVRRQSTGFSFC